MTTSASSLSSSSTSSTSTTPSIPLPSIFPNLSSSANPPTQIQQSFSIKLNSKNYIPWKLQFTPLLNFYNLHGILYGTEPCPPKDRENAEIHETELNPDYISWFSKDQILFSWLLSSITEEIYSYLIGLNTSAAIWNAFSTAFGTISPAQRTQLHIELHNISKADKPISQFLYQAKSIADNLALAGQPISDAEFNAIIFRQIGADYNPIIAALQQRSVPPTFHDLHGQLVAHELLLQTQQPVLPSANFVQRSSPTFPAFSGFNSRGRFSRGRGRGRFSPRQSVFCQICGFQNHTAIQCRRRFDSSIAAASFSDGRRQVGHSAQAHLASGPVETSLASRSNITPIPWYPDTGATHHVTPDLSSLSIVDEYKGTDKLVVGDGKALHIAHIGSALLPSPSKHLTLNNVLHVPAITKPLLSVQRLCTDNDCFMEFYPDRCFVKDQLTKTPLLKGVLDSGLYKLQSPINGQSQSTAAAFLASLEDWHNRLGHSNYQTVRALVNQFHLPCTSKQINSDKCEACCLGKLHRLSLPSTHHRSSRPLQLIHSDVWGPAPMSSSTGDRYFVIFIDDYSLFTWIFPIKQKSDVSSIFCQFQKLVENQLSCKIQSFNSDWGGEFRPLHSYFKNSGILHRISCPHTHEQNGTAERKIRNIVDIGLALLGHCGSPFKYWQYAFETAVFLINRLPSVSLSNGIPFQKLFNAPPDYLFLKVFGCAVYPLLRPYNQNKFSFRSKQCVFLGYSAHHFGYRCLDKDTGRIYLARHVQFDEKIFPFKILPSNGSHSKTSPTPPDAPWMQLSYSIPTSFQPTRSGTPLIPDSFSSLSTPHSPQSISQSTTSSPISSHHISNDSNKQIQQPDNSPQQPNPINTSQIITTIPPEPRPPNPHRTHPMLLRPNPKPKTYTASISSPSSSSLSTNPPALPLPTTEPSSFTQASKSSLWRHAMQQEIAALHKTNTWTLVPPPPNVNIVGNRWVYKIKRHANGTIERLKARLVAKGYTQEHGLDYTETFSPVIKPVTIRTVLSVALSRGWFFRQLDVSNAFLHGHLDETVYMHQPQGFVDKTKPQYVCKLIKSLYGLKQAPRAWFQRLGNFLLQLGFVGSHSDSSLFIYNQDGHHCFLLVYVDDILLTGSSESILQKLIEKMSTEFQLRDLGRLNYFLGIQVHYLSHGMLLSQRSYIQDLLRKMNMLGAKSCATPLSLGQHLSLQTGTLLNADDAHRYRQCCGSLQYASLTRPDISFAVNKLCQFMHQPMDSHYQALKRVLRYLNGTLSLGLFLTTPKTITLTAFTDADWAGCPDDRRSTGGYLIYFGNNLIAWNSKKQKTVARSSTESEFKAIADVCVELKWLTSLFHELGVTFKSSPHVWCDNLGAVFLSTNPAFQARTRHVEVDFHFVRNLVASKQLTVGNVSSADQIADLLTKSLPKQQFSFFLDKLRLLTVPPSA